MRECESQCPISSHRNSGDGAGRPPGANTIFVLNMWQEFLQEEVTVAHGTVGGIHVEAAPAFGRGDQKIADLMLVAQIIEQRPPSAIEQSSFIVAEAMQKIK